MTKVLSLNQIWSSNKPWNEGGNSSHSSLLLSRATNKASCPIMICNLLPFTSYYSCLFISLLISNHGKARCQIKLTHLLPLFRKGYAFALNRWKRYCSVHFMQQACFLFPNSQNYNLTPFFCPHVIIWLIAYNAVLKSSKLAEEGSLKGRKHIFLHFLN